MEMVYVYMEYRHFYHKTIATISANALRQLAHKTCLKIHQRRPTFKNTLPIKREIM